MDHFIVCSAPAMAITLTAASRPEKYFHGLAFVMLQDGVVSRLALLP